LTEEYASARRNAHVGWYADFQELLQLATIKVCRQLSRSHEFPGGVESLTPLVCAVSGQRDEKMGVFQRAEEAYRRARAEAEAAKRQQPLRLIAGVPDPWGSPAQEKKPERTRPVVVRGHEVPLAGRHNVCR
jgi:hypothetical protein